MDDREPGAFKVTAEQITGTAYYTRRRFAAGVASGAVLVFFTSCSGPSAIPPDSPAAAVLRIGVPEGDVSGADLGLPQVARNISFEGLTAWTNDGRAVPRLAESWTATPDGLSWEFTLRSGVKFHDGTAVDPNRVADSLRASISRPAALALRPGLLDVEEIFASGPRTVTIALRQRSAFLLDELDTPILSPSKPPAATGPFRIESSSPSEILMVANPDYYLGAPRIERVSIKAYPALRTAWASLMRGEIDMVSHISHDNVEFVSSENVTTHSFVRNYMYLIAFNSARAPFKSTTVRRALNTAIDREALVKTVLRGHGLAATGPLWPQHWAYDTSVSGYTFDSSLAASALDAAGFTLPRSVPGDGLPARLRFTCILPRQFSILEKLALAVQKQLYDVGVDMQLEALPADEYDARIRRGDFQAVIIDMIGGPSFARPYSFWRSQGEFKGLNVFGYRNPTADRWLDALRFAPDDAATRAAAAQLQRVMRDDPPALFLLWNERIRAISRRFHIPEEVGRDPLSSLRLWTLEAATAERSN